MVNPTAIVGCNIPGIEGYYRFGVAWRDRKKTIDPRISQIPQIKKIDAVPRLCHSGLKNGSIS